MDNFLDLTLFSAKTTSKHLLRSLTCCGVSLVAGFGMLGVWPVRRAVGRFNKRGHGRYALGERRRIGYSVSLPYQICDLAFYAEPFRIRSIS
jgi:hypothetical protein